MFGFEIVSHSFNVYRSDVFSFRSNEQVRDYSGDFIAKLKTAVRLHITSLKPFFLLDLKVKPYFES